MRWLNLHISKLYMAPELAAYALTRSFSYASHQCGCDSPTPNCRIYTVTGGSQYYGQLSPVPEGSVRWYAQRASRDRNGAHLPPSSRDHAHVHARKVLWLLQSLYTVMLKVFQFSVALTGWLGVALAYRCSVYASQL